MDATGDLAIDARELRKQFGVLTAVDGLSLAVTTGEIFGLVGPDGAGKTTAMRLLTGMLVPDGGEARVAGYDVIRQTEQMKAHIGYMPQRFSVYADLTVSENLYFYAGIYHVPRDVRLARERELLAFSRLEPFVKRLAGDLSGGMRQKLMLACTLMHTPGVLFLDEPTAGVDPVSRRDFWLILYDLLRQGVTILVSTPYMDEAERCNRVALIDRGQVIVTDTPEALRAGMPGDLLSLRATPQRKAQAILTALSDVKAVNIFGDRLHAWVTDAERGEPIIRQALTAQGIAVNEVQQQQPGLEDVFIALLGGGHP